MRVCDGCGAPADEAHVRARIERLELATRFRPIHIQVLLLGDAPPVRAADYFYRPVQDGTQRSVGAKEFFTAMLDAAGVPREPAGGNEEAALGEFQRRGFYLADAVECPVATGDELGALVARCAPTLVKRIEFSYRPKHVVAFGADRQQLIPVLRKSGVASRLVIVESPSGASGSLPVSGREIAAALARFA
jgi:hypothetical protein